MAERLFEGIFKVSELNPGGNKFDKVTRIEAKSDDMYMQLDVATEVYPMEKDETFTMILVTTLNLDGTPDTGYYTQAGKTTLADSYDYVMHGKLYKISEDVNLPKNYYRGLGTLKGERRPICTSFLRANCDILYLSAVYSVKIHVQQQASRALE